MADDPRPPTSPAGTALVVMLGAFALAALANADLLRHNAETRPLGPTRDVALAVWTPLDVARDALDPRTWPLDSVGSDRVETAASPSSLPVPAGPVASSTTEPTGSSAAATGETDDSADPDVDLTDPVEPLGLPPLGRARATDSLDPGPAPEATTEQDGAEAATETATPPGVPGPPTTRVVESSTAPAEVTSAPETTRAFPLRRPTVAEPLRVAVIGDSTLDTVGPPLERALLDTGVATVNVEIRVSTGMSRPDFHDWPARLAEIDATLAPEITVVMLGANDAQPIVVDGGVESFASEAWVAEYQRRLDALLTQVTAGDRWAILVGLPRMRSEGYDGRIRQIDALHEAAVAANPRAVIVHTDTFTTNAEGGYEAYAVDPDGTRHQIRRSDGVHFSIVGGERVAPLVLDAINAIAPLY